MLAGLAFREMLSQYPATVCFPGRSAGVTRGSGVPKRAVFVKGRFWRMCPRSGFRGPGLSEIIASSARAPFQGKRS